MCRHTFCEKSYMDFSQIVVWLYQHLKKQFAARNSNCFLANLVCDPPGKFLANRAGVAPGKFRVNLREIQFYFSQIVCATPQEIFWQIVRVPPQENLSQIVCVPSQGNFSHIVRWVPSICFEPCVACQFLQSAHTQHQENTFATIRAPAHEHIVKSTTCQTKKKVRHRARTTPDTILESYMC